ncbi:MAG: DUF4255 domain-containing protein [Flavobacteriales bacterium]
MNQYFNVKLSLNEDRVILSALGKQEGGIAVNTENKVVMSLVHIERETAFRNNPKLPALPVGTNQPIQLNLFVLFACNFSAGNYSEALRFLAFVIAFFQQKGSFTHSNTPSLNTRIEKINIEMAEVAFDQLNNLWSMLGTPYMPSALYKVRMIQIDDSIIREYRPNIEAIDSNSKNL